MRVCVICGSDKSSGSWGRIINDDGNWTGEWRCVVVDTIIISLVAIII
jgi:hypothetical protein